MITHYSQSNAEKITDPLTQKGTVILFNHIYVYEVTKVINIHDRAHFAFTEDGRPQGVVPPPIEKLSVIPN